MMPRRLTDGDERFIRKMERKRDAIYERAARRRNAEFNSRGLPKLNTQDKGEIMQIAWTLRTAGLPPLGAAERDRLSPEERSQAAREGWRTRRKNERTVSRKQAAKPKRKQAATKQRKSHSKQAPKRSKRSTTAKAPAAEATRTHQMSA